MKQVQDRRVAPPQAPPPRWSIDLIALGTLIGVVALLMITFSNMRDVDRLERTLNERLGKLETQIAQVGTRAPAAPAKGIDPNRVYTLKDVPDAPARGSAKAPVVIAEFSDFQ